MGWFLSRLVFGLMLVPVCLLGCGPSVESVPVQTSSAMEDVKKGLQSIADTGEIGSSIEDIRMNAGRLSGDDAGKTAGIQAGLDELSGMSDPAKIKVKAQELLKTL